MMFQKQYQKPANSDPDARKKDNKSELWIWLQRENPSEKFISKNPPFLAFNLASSLFAAQFSLQECQNDKDMCCNMWKAIRNP